MFCSHENKFNLTMQCLCYYWTLKRKHSRYYLIYTMWINALFGGLFFFNIISLKWWDYWLNCVIIYPSLEPGVFFQLYILFTHFQTSSQSKIICDKTPGSMSTVKPSDLLFAVDHPRRGQWQPTPVLLPGKSNGRRSLVGFSPWGR